MSKTQTIGVSEEKFPSDLQEDLEELDYYHNAGAVEVKVERVRPLGNGAVRVTFSPPVGDSFKRTWDIPQSPNERTGFGLLLRACGHNLATAENVIGERVPFTREDGEWEMAAEWPDPPLRERASDKLLAYTLPVAMGLGYAGVVILAPLTVSYRAYSSEYDGFWDDEVGWLLAMIVWAFGLFLALVFAEIVLFNVPGMEYTGEL